MDDNGRQPSGIEIDSNDQLASIHPEIWLSPEKIEELKEIQRQIEEEELKKKEAALAKKEKKKKKKKDQESPSKKKGIASKKNEPPVDPINQIALDLMNPDEDALEFELDFDLTEDLDGLM